MSVDLRLVPDQLVLSLTREVRLGQIDEFIDDSFDRLILLGERAGSLIVIYHGEIYADEHHPVEVCLPVVSAPAQLPDGVVARIEPTHREAYLRITKAQTDYPEISDQQDRLERWLDDNHVQVTGPFRELYLADFDAARMDDPVCELAYPISC